MKHINEKQLEAWFRKELGMVNVEGKEYPRHLILAYKDETAYNTAFNDWIDAKIKEGELIYNYKTSEGWIKCRR